MLHSSYIEISKPSLQNNIDFIRQRIGPGVRLSSVIKGNAYGHGIEPFAHAAQACGIDHFSVFSADEAQRLLQVLEQPATILIMGYLGLDEVEWAIANDIEFFVFELARLKEAATAAKRLKRAAKVHLELETGMNRTGFEGPSLNEALRLLKTSKSQLRLEGICTHFAGAEDSRNHDRVTEQLRRFRSAVAALEQEGLSATTLHSACSAAMMAYPQSHMDMVRIGIMQYGFWPSPEIKQRFLANQPGRKDPLQRLITWKSRVMSLKHVPKGEFVGYGSSHQALTDETLAIVPVGYAWGYSRELSNSGVVLIRGRRAKVVGIVNMNVMMVNVTDIPGVHQNDEVVLLGQQGDETITVASFAELSTQLNYELLTRLPINIPRHVVD